jgi:mannosyltransferase OCH1-like enzyme
MPEVRNEVIPHLIHQIWFAWKSPEIAPPLQRWQDTIREQNPGWRLQVWSDEECRSLLAAHYPWFLPHYDGYRHPIMRVDAIRPFLLHHHGGLYADLDVECLRPFAPLLVGDVQPALVQRPAKGPVGLVLALEKRLLTRHKCANAVMASRPKHAFWEVVFEELVARAGRKQRFYMPRENYVLAVTGPDCLDTVWRRTADQFGDTLVLQPAALCPLGWWERDGDLRDAIAVHHCASSWLSPPSVLWQRALRWLSGRARRARSTSR